MATKIKAFTSNAKKKKNLHWTLRVSASLFCSFFAKPAVEFYRRDK